MTALSQGIKRKLPLLQLADELRNVAKACRIRRILGRAQAELLASPLRASIAAREGCTGSQR